MSTFAVPVPVISNVISFVPLPDEGAGLPEVLDGDGVEDGLVDGDPVDLSAGTDVLRVTAACASA